MSDKRTILIIEDEHTISNFICRALNANDYKSIPAASGKEATARPGSSTARVQIKAISGTAAVTTVLTIILNKVAYQYSLLLERPLKFT